MLFLLAIQADGHYVYVSSFVTGGNSRKARTAGCLLARCSRRSLGSSLRTRRAFIGDLDFRWLVEGRKHASEGARPEMRIQIPRTPSPSLRFCNPGVLVSLSVPVLLWLCTLLTLLCIRIHRLRLTVTLMSIPFQIASISSNTPVLYTLHLTYTNYGVVLS